MKKISVIIVLSCFSVIGCKQNADKPAVDGKLNKTWLKKLEQESDSIYHKPYFRRDFVTAWYYFNKKDKTVCNEMRDSSENVRQVIITKNDIRTYYAQYYPDGQILSAASVGKNGEFEGDAVNYYPDGKIKSKGSYSNGLYSGTWETYDENGKLQLKEEYDSNGSVIKTTNY